MKIKSENKINHKRFLELFWEFNEFIVSLHTLYLDSIIGYEALHNAVLTHQADLLRLLGECEVTEEEFQDKCGMTYGDLCNEEHSVVSLSPVMKQGDIKKRTNKNGTNTILLGRQCIVAACSYWEGYLRKEVGVALGVLDFKKHKGEKIKEILDEYVRDDFWGDICKLRNSIVHNKGVASSKMKCKIIKWFSHGESINLDSQKMRFIFFNMGRYRNYLHTLSLPPHNGIRILKTET